MTGAVTVEVEDVVYFSSDVAQLGRAYAQGRCESAVGKVSPSDLCLKNGVGVVIHPRGTRVELMPSLGGNAVITAMQRRKPDSVISQATLPSEAITRCSFLPAPIGHRMIYALLVFSGALLCNCIPHLAAGLQGVPFPTPFAKPRGIGKSSPFMNFAWGASNLIAGIIIILTRLTLQDPVLGFLALTAGFLAAGAYVSLHFSKVRCDG